MIMTRVTIFLTALCAIIAQTYAVTPVVLWHGMGDSCCNPLSLGTITSLLKKQIPNLYVYSVQIGSNMAEDIENGFISNVNKQIDFVCKTIQADKNLQQGYHSVGFSQGGQFLRALAQRCPNPPMKNLISIGGQHQGVYGLPHCPGENTTLCDYVRKLLNLGAYIPFVQNNIVQAQYWHDSMNEQEYKEKSIFLADINNELKINQTYSTNLQKLTNFVMVKFTKDSMVEPRESEWFGFFKPGQAKEVVALRNSTIYTENRLGLKDMDRLGKLKFLSVVGDHLQFEESWFIKAIVNPYLKV